MTRSAAIASTVGPLATRKEAESLDREVSLVLGEMKCKWLRLGTLVKRVIDSQAFAALGFKTWTEWLRDRVGQGESMTTTLDALRCVRELAKVPEEKKKQMGVRNALMLTRLPKKLRTEDVWVDRAIKLKSEEMKDEVDVVMEKREGKPEAFRTWSLRVPDGVLQELRDAESKIAGLLGLDIVASPASRITVWSRIATLVNTTEKEHLVIEMGGGD